MAEKKDYFRWTESKGVNHEIDWKKADVIAAGVDVGSVSSQMVILVDGEIYAFSSTRSGSSSPNSANKALDMALDDTDLKVEDINYIVGTGYGRVNIPFANRSITEISCHAIGANYMYGPTVRTLLDMGGQDCKAIHLDEKGKVTNFLMNDKCAAGTGRGMEVIAELLAVPVTDIGKRSLDVDEEPPPVSSTCVVFAKSEATALQKDGWSKNMVLAAYCLSMANRVVDLLRRIEVETDFAITGGIGKNIGIVSRIQKILDVQALPARYDPQLAGALGASLYAQALWKRKRSKSA